MVIPKTICWAIAKANSFVHVVMFVFRTKKTVILLTIIEFEKKFWLQIKDIIDNKLALLSYTMENSKNRKGYLIC